MYNRITQHNKKHHIQNQVTDTIDATLNMNIHLHSNIHTYRHSLTYAISDIHNLKTKLKSVPNFSLQALKHNEMKLAEKYCWEITQAGRVYAAAYQVPLCWGLNFN